MNILYWGILNSTNVVLKPDKLDSNFTNFELLAYFCRLAVGPVSLTTHHSPRAIEIVILRFPGFDRLQPIQVRRYRPCPQETQTYAREVIKIRQPYCTYHVSLSVATSTCHEPVSLLSFSFTSPMLYRPSNAVGILPARAKQRASKKWSKMLSEVHMRCKTTPCRRNQPVSWLKLRFKTASEWTSPIESGIFPSMRHDIAVHAWVHG